MTSLDEEEEEASLEIVKSIPQSSLDIIGEQEESSLTILSSEVSKPAAVEPQLLNPPVEAQPELLNSLHDAPKEVEDNSPETLDLELVEATEDFEVLATVKQEKGSGNTAL